MTIGVASAQGSQEANSIENGRSQALPPPIACMVRSVWLASNSAAAHQMAAIQVQPVERACARIMTDTLHQGPGEDPGAATNGGFSATSGLKSLQVSP